MRTDLDRRQTVTLNLALALTRAPELAPAPPWQHVSQPTPRGQGAGSSKVNAYRLETPLNAMRDAAQPAGEVRACLAQRPKMATLKFAHELYLLPQVPVCDLEVTIGLHP